MPQAQFFQLNPQSSFADDIKSGYEAGYNIREGQRKKALNEIYSKHVKPDGSFDSENFLKEAADAGIGPEMTSTWLNQKTAKSDATVKEATNAEMLSVLGRKPDVLRDWFIQEKEKAAKLNNPTEQGDGGPLTPSTLDVDKLSDNRDEVDKKQAAADSKVTDSGVMLSPPTGPKVPATAPVSQQLQEMFNKKGVEGIQASDAADLLDRVPGNSDRTDISGRIYSAPEGKFTEKDISNLTAQPFDEVDQGKKYDIVEEALRREPGQSGPAGKLGDIQTPGTFQSDSVKWEPKDDGSNEYRQFKATLDSQLKALDMKSASDYLQKIGENTYKQNLYVPNQMAWMTKDGKIDYSAMGAEIAKVKDSDQKARAKAEEAIQKAKDNLMETAQKYGVSTIASISEKREVEKQEAEMQGRRPEGYQFRYVTPAEASKGRDIISSYFDIQDGIKRGGFEGAYAAALAKAKADGSVNADAIVGNLVAMGAIPSQKAVYIKSLMSQNGSMTGDMWNQAKASVGKFMTKGLDPKWGDDALKNLTETARLYGYDIKGSSYKKTRVPTEVSKEMSKPAKSVSQKRGTDAKGRKAL